MAGKIQYIPLSRWRERAGVRVDMIFPLTFILSPGGEEIVSVYLLGTQISERLKRNEMH
jgi:hypothetical protein